MECPHRNICRSEDKVCKDYIENYCGVDRELKQQWIFFLTEDCNNFEFENLIRKEPDEPIREKKSMDEEMACE
jgi:hypothetical protein